MEAEGAKIRAITTETTTEGTVGVEEAEIGTGTITRTKAATTTIAQTTAREAARATDSTAEASMEAVGARIRAGAGTTEIVIIISLGVGIGTGITEMGATEAGMDVVTTPGTITPRKTILITASILGAIEAILGRKVGNISRETTPEGRITTEMAGTAHLAPGAIIAKTRAVEVSGVSTVAAQAVEAAASSTQTPSVAEEALTPSIATPSARTTKISRTAETGVEGAGEAEVALTGAISAEEGATTTKTTDLEVRMTSITGLIAGAGRAARTITSTAKATTAIEGGIRGVGVAAEGAGEAIIGPREVEGASGRAPATTSIAVEVVEGIGIIPGKTPITTAMVTMGSTTELILTILAKEGLEEVIAGTREEMAEEAPEGAPTSGEAAAPSSEARRTTLGVEEAVLLSWTLSAATRGVPRTYSTPGHRGAVSRAKTTTSSPTETSQGSLTTLTGKKSIFNTINTFRNPLVRENNNKSVEIENVVGEKIEIEDTPLKDFFGSKNFLGTYNQDAKEIFCDKLIEELKSM